MKKTLSEREINIIDNMINKLRIYMVHNNERLLGLSILLGFTYQPFYRLMKSRKIPDSSSMAALAERLDCSIGELINDQIFLDIPVVTSAANPDISKSKEKIKLSFPIATYMPHVRRDFFAIKMKQLQLPNIKYYNVYFKTDEIISDGVFIVNYQENIVELNIVSVGSKFIFVELDNEEKRIPRSDVQPLAMLFNSAIVTDANCNYIYGISITNKK